MTFVFHHGGKFKNDEGGSKIYEPDNTKGYYKELGYSEVDGCYWKVPEMSLEVGLRKLEVDADLLEMVKDCRRNHNSINIYFVHRVSEPHMVECMTEDDDELVILENQSTCKPKTTNTSQLNKRYCLRPKSQPLSQPKPQPMSTPNNTPPQPKFQPKSQSMCQPKSQPKSQVMSQPKSQPETQFVLHNQPLKSSSQPSRLSQSLRSQPFKKHVVGDKKKEPVKGTNVTRSGRVVTPAPRQGDSDSHDSYESTEDSLYKPPKILGDGYESSGDSDSDSGVVAGKNSGSKKYGNKEKSRPASHKTTEKEIDTDDSSYEDIEDDEISDSGDMQFTLRIIMKSMIENRQKLLHYQGILTPVQQSRLEAMTKMSRNWFSQWSGDDKEVLYEVQGSPTNIVVDLGSRTCTCRFWQLTDMPCMHAIAAIQDKNDKRPEEYCHEWLTMDAYRRTYCFNVNPIKEQDLWEKTGSPALVPPPVKIKPGRPTMNTRKDKDEQPISSKTRMKRKYNPIRCLYCVVVDPADANAEHAPNETPIDPVTQDPTNPPAATLNAPIEMIIDQSEGVPVTQESQPLSVFSQDKVRARPPKLHVKKGKATIPASPQPAATTTIPVSAETIKGTSSATAKKLASFMTFVPTPGFKHPRKKDNDKQVLSIFILLFRMEELEPKLPTDRGDNPALRPPPALCILASKPG
ncbi:hypothetical protein Ahy_B01g052125 [Arachis hypogaea]|uniref:SWIM-type domain-containing protein n=1 Tax=Arachis hypogaea TaxID=3818 RepID=A0A445ANR6_ARAHY|nr:hypothetical protein Ahy_B01g052125 [Arachis hypogaea]